MDRPDVGRRRFLRTGLPAAGAVLVAGAMIKMSKSKNGMSPMGTVSTFVKTGHCSETLFHVLNRAFDHPMLEEERASKPLAGGIMPHGYQCGMIWGATLAAGAQAYRLLGKGPHGEAKAIAAAQRIVESFRTQNHHINCFEITEVDMKAPTMGTFVRALIKGQVTGCLRMATRYAPLAFGEINTALSEEHVDALPAPVSCSAMVAKKMGASDMHSVMAAGLGGGIGLCGGACGALGAAIWITRMNDLKQGARTDACLANTHVAIDRFLKCTDYEFECSKIVGRKFESIGDHARYLSNGGCSKVIEALAAT